MLLRTILYFLSICVIGITTQNISLEVTVDNPESIGNVTERQKRCELITVSSCRGINYEYTRFPNTFNHQTQDEAAISVQEFMSLFRHNCSPDLKFFICSLYTPICMENYERPLPPCRSVCERVRSGCAVTMHQFGFHWPETMNCANFPRLGDSDSLCIGENVV